jgi:hypothetical protein
MRAGQNRSPDFVSVLREAAAQAIDGLYVGMPGVVVKYDPVTQTADVLPLVHRPYINDDGSRGSDVLPVLPGVRVMFPRGGGHFVSFPLLPGDGVLLMFMDRSIDDWEVGSGTVPVDPEETRQHDLSDAIALPGMFPLPKVIKDVIATSAVFGKEKGAQVRSTGAAIEITTAGLPASVGGYVAMANLVAANLALIATAITGLGGSYTPTAVASTNLKAD